MSLFRSIVRELKEIKDGVAFISGRSSDGKQRHRQRRSHIAPDVPEPPVQQGQWANLPPELLLDIIRRVEESETSWPSRAVILSCASVCKSWRAITKEIVKTPEQCGRLTFLISLKQPGPRDSPIQCFIKRNRKTSTYLLYSGPEPSENKNDKLLLAAKKIRRITNTAFVISLVADDFSRASKSYIGKLRSNFLDDKFTIYDSQPPDEGGVESRSGIVQSKKACRRAVARNYDVGSITYKISIVHRCRVHRIKGPRRMKCIMNCIPVSAIQEGGTAPTPTSFPDIFEPPPVLSLSEPTVLSQGSMEPLALKNKAPIWHEELQHFYLTSFRACAAVASDKNFQLVVAVDSSHNVSAQEQEKVILEFFRIGKDIFTMDYRYPLSAFQAFSICLSSFDAKPIE